jgi:protein SCO1/2
MCLTIMKNFHLIILSTLLFSACKQNHLPILGERTVQTITKDGKEVTDTIYQTIPPFSFTDQDGQTVTNETFKDKIYVADFIFLSCQTICPKMNLQMKRLHDIFIDDPEVVFLSHSIDPENDTTARLKSYAESNKIKTSKWHLVRGSEDSIYNIAEKGYLSTVYKDSADQFVHSGGMLLVDKKGRVRGMYDGTQQYPVDDLINDIKILKKEE